MTTFAFDSGVLPSIDRSTSNTLTPIDINSPFALPNNDFGVSGFGDRQNQLREGTQSVQFTGQSPTNVVDIRPELLSALRTFTGQVGSINAPGSLPGVALQSGFQGAAGLPSLFTGGIDQLGRLGISAGLEQLRGQTQSANTQLQNQLGRNAGNQSLIGVLQNQNRMREQLAAQPLITQALQGSAERDIARRSAAVQGVQLDNLALQLANQARLSQADFNRSGDLALFQAQLAGLQPSQNLVDILTTLQGQARGVETLDQQGNRLFA